MEVALGWAGLGRAGLARAPSRERVCQRLPRATLTTAHHHHICRTSSKGCHNSCTSRELGVPTLA